MKTSLLHKVSFLFLAVLGGRACLMAVAPSSQAELPDKLGYHYDPAIRATEGAPATVLVTSVEPPEVVMDRLVVTAKKLNLEPHEMLTQRGRMVEAKRKHLSPVYQKTFGPLAQLAGYYFNWLSILGGWHPNETEAYLFAEQDERLRILRGLSELEKLDRLGREPAPGSKAKK